MLVSCSGGADSTVPPNAGLFTLSREGVPPAASVFLIDDGGWIITSQDACRGTTGSIPSDKTAELHQYLSDPGLATGSSACTDTSFELIIFNHLGVSGQPLCWSDDARRSSLAIDALSQFFDDRVKDLNWDGKKVDPCNPMPLTIDPQELAQRGSQGSPDDAPAPMQQRH
jgi:hypothetical protein